MRNAIWEFVRQEWETWQYIGLGFAVGLILIGWRVALALAALLATFYALGWLTQRALRLVAAPSDREET